jgi:hypothetical protein
LSTDARLTQAQALRALGREEEATEILASERKTVWPHRDRQRMERLRAIERGVELRPAGDPIKVHLELADRAQRAANSYDELEHYRAARVLLEVRGQTRT